MTLVGTGAMFVVSGSGLTKHHGGVTDGQEQTLEGRWSSV
jgi:hypothetical protein